MDYAKLRQKLHFWSLLLALEPFLKRNIYILYMALYSVFRITCWVIKDKNNMFIEYFEVFDYYVLVGPPSNPSVSN